MDTSTEEREEERRLSVLISGSSGLVGRAVSRLLESQGHRVTRLVRTAPPQGSGFVYWNPAAREIDRSSLEGFDAVVHLAGENVGSGRWTAQKKRLIRASRVEGTQLLSRALAALDRPPSVMACASAIGFYGDRGEEILCEESGPGRGFLPEVCVAWEEAAAPAREAGVRVVHLRLGIVLSREGGPLARLLRPFRLGLGGVIGSGRQYISWIAIDDVARVFFHALENENLSGPVNAVAPGPVTNRELTRALGRALGRPTMLPLPGFIVRAAFGEMGEALLLSSARVVPGRLRDVGFDFRYPTIYSALDQLLSER